MHKLYGIKNICDLLDVSTHTISIKKDIVGECVLFYALEVADGNSI